MGCIPFHYKETFFDLIPFFLIMNSIFLNGKTVTLTLFVCLHFFGMLHNFTLNLDQFVLDVFYIQPIIVFLYVTQFF